MATLVSLTGHCLAAMTKKSRNGKHSRNSRHYKYCTSVIWKNNAQNPQSRVQIQALGAFKFFVCLL